MSSRRKVDTGFPDQGPTTIKPSLCLGIGPRQLLKLQ